SPEDVSPRTVRAHGSAGAPRAVREARDAPDFNITAIDCCCRSRGEQRAGTRLVRLAYAPAGDAGLDDGRVHRRRPRCGCRAGIEKSRGTPPGPARTNGRSPGSRVFARPRLPG